MHAETLNQLNNLTSRLQTMFISVCKCQSSNKWKQHFLYLFLCSRIHRPGGRRAKVLLFLFYWKVSSQSHCPGAAVGASAPGGRGDNRVPANLPSDAGHRREQAHTNPLLKDRRERRGQLLAKHRRQASVNCVAAAARDQLGHRNQCLRFEGKWFSRDLHRARRGGSGESNFLFLP